MELANLHENYYSNGLRARFCLDSLKLAETANNTPGYAKISYSIDERAYQRRSRVHVMAGGLPSSVPKEWPAKLTGPLVWSSTDFHSENEFVYILSNADKSEIQLALKYFKDRGFDGNQISRDTFPLPSLGKCLDDIRHDIYHGHGFAIVRGLDPDAYVVEDMTIAYLGISAYIGDRRGKQDQRGSMLMHIIYRGEDAQDPEISMEKPFHTDTVTDCLCLFTKGIAATGGRNFLASAWTVYNELSQTRPDLIHVLAEPTWPFDTFGRSPPYYRRALMYFYNGKLITSFSRRLLTTHPPHRPRTEGIPGLTERQAEALDALHFIAKRHEIKPRMLKGDLRFVNNMAIMHRREAFKNDSDHERHLIRFWVNNERLCWKLPRDLRIAWARIFEDDEREENWDMEPIREGGKILRIGGSCD